VQDIAAPARCARRRQARKFPILAATLLLAPACGDSPSTPSHGVDLNALFRAAAPAEIAAVEAEWAARTPAAQGVTAEVTTSMLMAGGPGTVRVFSHLVDGHRHYGATLSPAGAAPGSLPVVVYAHGGDEGVSVDALATMTFLLGAPARDFVYVIPSFRSEPLSVSNSAWTSGGEASPWDRDVDDALAFLDVVLQRVPEADSRRIGVLGVSRGGGVGLLMAIRDPRIDRVAVMAGPTDFLGPWVRQVTEEALAGRPRDLPGLRVMNQRFIQPLGRGEITEAAVRRELIRRSPVLWPQRLPPVQVHHGTADVVVPVEQAESLRAALQRVGGRTGDEFFLYPGAGHNLLERREIDARLVAWLEAVRGG
jgi:dipeptidyl aminopeptidase/acylaminoacyl peptidase